MQPSRQPSTQPTGQPSCAPTLSGTGEWTTIVDNTGVFEALSFINGSVWACGGSADSTDISSFCSLVNVVTGELSTQFQFPWDMITSVLETTDNTEVLFTGRTTTAGVVSSELATCAYTLTQLSCAVKTLRFVNITKGSYNANGRKFVYVGSNSNRAAASLYDRTNNSLQSFVYSSTTMASIALTQVQNPPNFLGSFVAGTSVGTTSAAVNNIFAGWLRTDSGQMVSAMGITPVSGDIVSTTDLVNAMALETTGPDSFVAGGLKLSDNAGVHAYLIRANALYKTILYGMRYLPKVSTNRRLLSASTATVTHSVVRGVTRADAALFMISDAYQASNRTSLGVLKLQASTGAITKQALVSVIGGNLLCTDISPAGELLSIACSVVRGAVTQSMLFGMDRELTFFYLPPGFVRDGNATFQSQTLALKVAAVTVSSPRTVVSVTDSELVISDLGPTRSPTIAPSMQPSSYPSSVPSAQPVSYPTSTPTISSRPTSQPSTSRPTNTHKPSQEPTAAPTRSPTTLGTARPSPRPSARPTARPSAVPTSARPSAQPTVAPTVVVTARPSFRPTRVPTARPSVRSADPTSTPTLAPKIESQPLGAKFVVGVTVGGAVCLGLCGLYVMYRRRTRRILKKAAVEKRSKMVPVNTFLFPPPPAAGPPARPPLIRHVLPPVNERRSVPWYASSSDTAHSNEDEGEGEGWEDSSAVYSMPTASSSTAEWSDIGDENLMLLMRDGVGRDDSDSSFHLSSLRTSEQHSVTSLTNYSNINSLRSNERSVDSFDAFDPFDHFDNQSGELHLPPLSLNLPMYAVDGSIETISMVSERKRAFSSSHSSSRKSSSKLSSSNKSKHDKLDKQNVRAKFSAYLEKNSGSSGVSDISAMSEISEMRDTREKNAVRAMSEVDEGEKSESDVDIEVSDSEFSDSSGSSDSHSQP